MMTRSSTLSRCLALLGFSIAATVAAVLIQPSGRPPRWDLFACLAAAAVAVVGASLYLRRPSSNAVEAGGKHWWVEQRNGWVGFAAWSWVVLAFLVAYAALSPAPAAYAIVDAGSAMRTTEIEKVLSTKYVRSQRTGHYSSTVQVSVPFDRGPKISDAEMTSSDKPRPGDEVWVLFAPSSPDLGFFIGDRQSLEEKVGGRADLWFVFSTLGCLAFCWLMNLFGRWRSDPVAGLHRSHQHGTLHALPVSVTGVGVALDERPASTSETKYLKPRMRMMSADFGELHLYLDDIVDPAPLARLITGAQGHVYWRRPTRQLPYANSVGYAVVILDGQRYVAGWLESPDASVSLPMSALVPADQQLPAVGVHRALHPVSPVEASANFTVLKALLLGIVALSVITFGVGDLATVVLSLASVLTVLVGRRLAGRQVKRHLESLVPAET
ncbi:hypothetical protein [Streptomyces djakartensis]|uniref:DUF3592 domain-containing protein n=1 Tax=Streptomyces djakartensis TaxID=68193 RepID=A0ABQ3AE10_9ACTN|nr:hypothetical protein [Streptomyces djakartensis]GGY48856.1 hypothetical protein GCM10010384_63900 [Streptomyces djakartensis]